VTTLFLDRYPAERDSIPAARHAVIEALSGTGFSDPDLHSKVSLALTEATGNAVRHAYPEGVTGHVDVAVDRTADGIVIVVSDHGGGMRNDDRSAGSSGSVWC
jgi:anti-sigma regulatory factor (Ser/Thr protein kinase)